MDDLVKIQDLYVWFKVYGGYMKVLNGVNFSLGKGEKVSIVGETGCGKTTTMKTILWILSSQAYIPKGEVLFEGKDVLKMKESEIKRLRGRGAAMIFQDPMASLNPVFTIGDQLAAVISNSGIRDLDKEKIRQLSINALKEVKLPDPDRILGSYPFQMSGGMRQRICIAMALATERALIIADEPTTNLDVTIQDQILALLREMVAKRGNSLILITHSMGIARENADRIYVMYAGNMVEVSDNEELFSNPLHPYTEMLLSCVPKLSGGGIAEGIPGRIPDYLNPPPGCRFEPRCPYAFKRCREEKPDFFDMGNGHKVACFKYD
ncbi:D,D-dipeptide ABC transport system ATP-binding protein DppD [Thermacetogenium phaeum DSM 12270]|uniref:D,D-dipeptide ABC transport system ATP-binding protein DppD n=1 Tax=Thermacetogenium phaeum (strain ATCC BAA-254 / DSM 26808 / PB) TaxID=1089553 RepID=K4LFX8_THEPS|nr:oligopeptide/dipeptide ABC transporter ATP-binding protein [Thermacetogenium phaeum]AFV11911.1 D,D-dipeptide ABC transport system ATP-binding protein DppD [Thermacetogenium phaeum DSM 12270]